MADGKLPVCAVVGVGPGNGEAFARRFAADGHAVALMARSNALTGKLAARGLSVGVVLSGGNVGAARFAELVSTGPSARAG